MKILYNIGVVLIMVGFIITAITAVIERDWKNAVIATLFAIANGIIFLW